MSPTSRHPWFLLGQAPGTARVVVQQASSGLWERDPCSGVPPAGEVLFWRVSGGDLGAVITTASGVLVTDALAQALARECEGSLGTLRASVVHPRDAVPPLSYVLLRPQLGISMADLLTVESTRREVRHVTEAPQDIACSDALARRLDLASFPGLCFEAPLYLGGAS